MQPIVILAQESSRVRARGKKQPCLQKPVMIGNGKEMVMSYMVLAQLQRPTYLPIWKFQELELDSQGLDKEKIGGKVPISWDAKAITSQIGWVKILQAPMKGEPCHFGRHVEMMDPIAWQAKQVTYHTRKGRSMIAVDLDTAETCGADWMTLSNYKVPIMCMDVADKKMADVDKVTTPPTPPPGANILWIAHPRPEKRTEEVVEEDPGQVAPPERDLRKVSFENNGCTICGKRSRGEPNPLVFTNCWICGDSPAYHHGRCCPARTEWASGQIASTNEQTLERVQLEQTPSSRPPPNSSPF